MPWEKSHKVKKKEKKMETIRGRMCPYNKEYMNKSCMCKIKDMVSDREPNKDLKYSYEKKNKWVSRRMGVICLVTS